MSQKTLTFPPLSREKFLRGSEILRKAVSAAIGPAGKSVLISNGDSVAVSTNGYKIAKSLMLEDPDENMAVSVLRESCRRVSSEVGDGTTTAILIATALYRELSKRITAGIDVRELKRGVELAAKIAEERLFAMKRPATEPNVRYAALSSAAWDQALVDLIMDVLKKMGNEGVISVQRSLSSETIVEYSEGMKFERGYASPHFVTNVETLTAEYDDCYALLVAKSILSTREILGVLEAIMRRGGGKPLLIVADDIGGEAMATLVVNKLKNFLRVVAVKTPGFGEHKLHLLEDLATLTGATVVSEEKGLSLETADLNVLGKAKRIVVTSEETTVIGGGGDPTKIKERIRELKILFEKTPMGPLRQRLQERISKLTGGVATIKVGANAETELEHKLERTNDALYAARAALMEGVVPGGGVAYVVAARDLNFLNRDLSFSEQAGVSAFKEALLAPFIAIVSNAAIPEAKALLQDVMESTSFVGYDVRKKEKIDMFEAGIVDALKTIRLSLKAGVSAAMTLATAECSITEKNRREMSKTFVEDQFENE